jgi:ABC-type Zn uptake system ZnuABC Zn-binding protein ZnuA
MRSVFLVLVLLVGQSVGALLAAPGRGGFANPPLQETVIFEPQQAYAQNQRLHIVASFSILADVVQHVAGDAADVETLIPIGVDPHTFEPSAQDVVTLSEADVVFVAGLFFEGGLLDVLREASRTYYEMWGCLPIRPVMFDFEAHEDDAHDNGEGITPDQTDSLTALCEAHYETVKTVFERDTLAPAGAVTRLDSNYYDVLGEVDPHVWTDPANVALWALMIRDMLIAVDPVNAEQYQANTEAYLVELAALGHDLAAQIESIPQDRRVIMTNHATLNYFAARYGLTVVGVVIPGGSTTSEPSVEDVLNLIETVQDYNVPAIFTESTVREDLAEQIAEESGARIVQLYEGSLSDPDGPAATYLDYMRFTAATIAEALQ